MTYSIKKNVILNGFRMSLTVLMPLITFPYISRVFFVDQIGMLNFAQSVASVFSLISSLGIYTYGVREGAKVKDDKKVFSSFAFEIMTINFVSTTIMYILFFISLYTVSEFYNCRYLLLINGISIGASALGLDWVFGVFEEYGYITKRQIICQIVTIACMFVFVKDSTDLYVWAVISVISNIGANVFNLFYSRKFINYSLFKFFPVQNLIKHLKSIFVLFATRIASVVYTNVDSILLGFLSTTVSVGFYSTAIKINTILITCFSAMYPVFLPRIMQYLKDKKKEEYIDTIKKIFAFSIMIGLPIVLGLEILAKELILLLAGEQYVNSVTTMRILLPIILLNTVSGVIFYDVLVPFGKEKIVLLCTAISAIVNIGISTLLIPIWSQNGAAIGSLFAEGVSMICAFGFAYKIESQVATAFPKCTKYLLANTFMLIVIVPLSFALKNGFTKIILISITGFLAYCGSLYLLKDCYCIEIIRDIKTMFRIGDKQ